MAEELGARHGGWYGFAHDSSYVNSQWKALYWLWAFFPRSYNKRYFAEARLAALDTWEDLLTGRSDAQEARPFRYKRENFNAWIVASFGFDQPPLRYDENHPVRSQNPKAALLKEAEYPRAFGWPAKPNEFFQLINNTYILPNMGAKALTGTPMKEAIAWEKERDNMARAGVTSPFWLPPG